jgi:hypothetical protein
MNFVDLQTEKLSVTRNGEVYSKSFYKGAISITGVADENYSNYSDSADYVVGSKVIVPELKSIYISTAGDATTPNRANHPAFTTKWLFYSYVNSQNMFALDEGIGSKTVGVDVVATLEFNMIDTLALVDIDFESLKVEQFYDGAVRNEIDISARDLSFREFDEYCFKPLKTKRKVIIDLEWLPNSTVVLTFTGNVSIGILGRGRKEDLGINLVGNRLDWQSNSKFKIDEFTGFRTVLRQGKVRVLSADIIVNTNDFNATALKVDEIFDRNVLFIPTIHDEFNEAIVIGYLEGFSMNLNKSTIPTTAKIVGVAQ